MKDGFSDDLYLSVYKIYFQLNIMEIFINQINNGASRRFDLNDQQIAELYVNQL